MRRRNAAVAATLAVLLALLAGGGEGMSEQHAQCISEAVVDTIGVDALKEAGVWDDLQADPEAALADYGVVVGEQQVSAISTGIGACIDVGSSSSR